MSTYTSILSGELLDALLGHAKAHLGPALYLCCKALYKHWPAARESAVQCLIRQHGAIRRDIHAYSLTLRMITWSGIELLPVYEELYTICGKHECRSHVCRALQFRVVPSRHGHIGETRKHVQLTKHDVINGLWFRLTVYGKSLDKTFLIMNDLSQAAPNWQPVDIMVSIATRNTVEFSSVLRVHLRSSPNRYPVDGVWISLKLTECAVGALLATITGRIGDILAYLRSAMVDCAGHLGANLVAALSRRPIKNTR